MTTNLLASAVPPPVVPGTQFYSVDYAIPNAPLHSMVNFDISMQGGLASSRLNQDMSKVELVSRLGGGGYGIGYGLGYASASGLVVTVQAGIGLINGPVEKKTTSNVTMTDNTTDQWIWLDQLGNVVAGSGTSIVNPSANEAIPLFCVTTVSGAVTAQDNSGVCYFRNGNLWRTTGDLGAPSDTPNAALRLFTVTQAGLWLWDGTKHRFLSGQGYRNITGTTTLASSDEAITVDCTGGNVTLTLMSAASYAGRILTVRRTDASGNTLTVQRAGSDTIDGGTSITISASGNKRILSTGSAFFSM